MVVGTQSGLWTDRMQGFMYLGVVGAGGEGGAVCTGICKILFRAKTLRKLTCAASVLVKRARTDTFWSLTGPSFCR